jgi:hypothetical protein
MGSLNHFQEGFHLISLGFLVDMVNDVGDGLMVIMVGQPMEACVVG